MTDKQQSKPEYYSTDVPSACDVTPHAPFCAGCSGCKLFTALAIIQLYEAGRLGLDDPVVTYLPIFALSSGEGSEMTIRQLHHTRRRGSRLEYELPGVRDAVHLRTSWDDP